MVEFALAVATAPAMSSSSQARDLPISIAPPSRTTLPTASAALHPWTLARRACSCSPETPPRPYPLFHTDRTTRSFRVPTALAAKERPVQVSTPRVPRLCLPRRSHLPVARVVTIPPRRPPSVATRAARCSPICALTMPAPPTTIVIITTPRHRTRTFRRPWPATL